MPFSWADLSLNDRRSNARTSSLLPKGGILLNHEEEVEEEGKEDDTRGEVNRLFCVRDMPVIRSISVPNFGGHLVVVDGVVVTFSEGV